MNRHLDWNQSGKDENNRATEDADYRVFLKSFSRLGSNQTKVEKRLKTRNNHLSIVDIMITFIMSPLNVSGRDPVVGRYVMYGRILCP